MALVKSMLFIDGENLTMRFQAMQAASRKPLPNVIHVVDEFVWSPLPQRAIVDTDVIRINYYTSKVGDDDAVSALKQTIASNWYFMSGDVLGPCQMHPRVYKKPQKSHKSRLVDINIAIDVMRYAYTNAIDVVYIFSGDGDFVNLIEEVGRSGRRVCVAAFTSGLDPRLRVASDRFVELDNYYFERPSIAGQPSVEVIKQPAHTVDNPPVVEPQAPKGPASP